MKIFFSTLFDQPTYPANIFMQNGVSVGNRHMGPFTLLDFLELHLGLPNSCTNKIERIFNYRKNLQDHAKGSFYERSLAVNDLEVAAKLIQWRDDLKTAGWDFKIDSSCPPRLRDLAKVQQSNIGAGNAERFFNIITALKKKPQLPIDEIIVNEPRDLLPAYITHLFALLAGAGITINYRDIPVPKLGASDLDKLRSFVLHKDSSQKKTTVNADGSIQIIKFSDMLSAGNGLAALMADDPSFKPVVVNEPGDISLSLSLIHNGLPSTGQAMESTSHPDLQLLAIITVWLWKPYNPQQVLDFFLSPLNIFSQALSSKWMGSFTENPGIPVDEWLAEIDRYHTKFKTEKEKDKYQARLNFILNMGEDHHVKISTETVIIYYSYFYQVFLKRSAVTKDIQLKTRLQRLCDAFKEFIAVLKIAPEPELNLYDLQKLLQLVLQPVSIIPCEKQAGSLHEISAPGLLTGDCDDLLWFGFNLNKTGSTLWDELTGDEINWLKQKNVFLDTAVLKAKRDFWFLTQWLLFVKERLILVIPSVVNGEPAQPHPFHPFLNACFTNLHLITINVEQPAEMRLLNISRKLTKKTSVHAIPTYPEYWQIDGDLLTAREEESFSSLENLMKYPYRWVLAYNANLYRGETLALPANFMFYGTLSHRIFQELLLVPGVLKMSESQLKKLYATTAQKCIDQKGLLLYVQGEEGNLKIFREYLFEKFRTLVDHLKENDWEIEGCELKVSGKVGREAVGGKCDLLLRRTKNNVLEKAVVDLKYAGKSKYRKLMEDGEDLQLAIYSKIFHPLANYCATSYYIITEGILFTTCKDAFMNGFILRRDSNYVATYTGVLQRIENTIQFRRQELNEGSIEVGENSSTEALEIFKKSQASYIIPPKEKNAKCRSDYNDYVTFIDTE